MRPPLNSLVPAGSVTPGPNDYFGPSASALHPPPPIHKWMWVQKRTLDLTSSSPPAFPASSSDLRRRGLSSSQLPTSTMDRGRQDDRPPYKRSYDKFAAGGSRQDDRAYSGERRQDRERSPERSLEDQQRAPDGGKPSALH